LFSLGDEEVEMSAGKGDRNRVQDRKSWENSKLWASIDKKKLLESTQQIIEIKQKEK
jgi:hypothetical protein